MISKTIFSFKTFFITLLLTCLLSSASYGVPPEPNRLLQVIPRTDGNIYYRSVKINNGVIDWDDYIGWFDRPYWGSTGPDTFYWGYFPHNGQQYDIFWAADFVSGNKYYAIIWEKDKVYEKSFNVTNGIFRWNSGGQWTDVTSRFDFFNIGNLRIPASYDTFILGNKLHEGVWVWDRNKPDNQGLEGYTREVPLSATGVPLWNQAPQWQGPFNGNSLPGEGIYFASESFVLGNNLHQSIWRADGGHTRLVPIVNGVIKWQQASQWDGPIDPGAGSADIMALTNHAVYVNKTYVYAPVSKGKTRDMIHNEVILNTDLNGTHTVVEFSNGVSVNQVSLNFVNGKVNYTLTPEPNPPHEKQIKIHVIGGAAIESNVFRFK